MRELESRAFVLLRRAQGAPPLVEDEAEALQARYLTYLEELSWRRRESWSARG